MQYSHAAIELGNGVVFSSNGSGSHFENIDDSLSQLDKRTIDIYRHVDSEKFDEKAALEYARESISRGSVSYIVPKFDPEFNVEITSTVGKGTTVLAWVPRWGS